MRCRVRPCSETRAHSSCGQRIRVQAMAKEEMDAIIDRALREAEHEGVTGKRVTPFLLDRIKQLTGGRSLAANIALVKHNAVVGAGIARALTGLQKTSA